MMELQSDPFIRELVYAQAIGKILHGILPLSHARDSK